MNLFVALFDSLIQKSEYGKKYMSFTVECALGNDLNWFSLMPNLVITEKIWIPLIQCLSEFVSANQHKKLLFSITPMESHIISTQEMDINADTTHADAIFALSTLDIPSTVKLHKDYATLKNGLSLGSCRKWLSMCYSDEYIPTLIKHFRDAGCSIFVITRVQQYSVFKERGKQIQ